MEDKTKTTTVQYSCDLCGLKDIPVEVKAREKDDDILDWMTKIGYDLAEDHNKRSLQCSPKTLSNIKIPLKNTEVIGGPIIK